MKILVPVKRVIDYNVKPRVKADGTGDEFHVTREVDGGLETVKLTISAAITTDLRLNDLFKVCRN